ncbi:MAG: hypothetical protein AAGC65_10535 [Mucilaginibacter sp.]|uniref:hypothetical protein n=1 Tax=Mucilaginibacter sp. TaxID=1882438 RepID=UPI0031A0B910
MRYVIICVFALSVLIACKQSANKSVKKADTVVKAPLSLIVKKDTVGKKVYPLTDSGQLMMHLDSLPKAVFPYKSDGNMQSVIAIDLSAFKNKKLHNIPLKLIPTQLGAGFLDSAEDDSDSSAVSFNLVDTANHKVEGVLVAIRPKFVVIDLRGILVTLSYHVEVIDAIHTVTGDGNNHWQISRTSTINKDLTIVLHHSWSAESYKKGHFDSENDEEKWFIDSGGHIKKQ